MKKKELIDSAKRLEKTAKHLEQFFVGDYKHIEKFSGKEVQNVQYVVSSPKGIEIGFNREFGVIIPWRDFLEYLFDDIIEYK